MSNLQQRIREHIAKGPQREYEALLQASLGKPFRSLRQAVLRARKRKDRATEDLLVGLGTIYTELAIRMLNGGKEL